MLGPLIVAVALAGCVSDLPTDDEPAASDQEPEQLSGQVTSARCVTEYSPETLRDRAFAFDGTVVELRSERDPRAPGTDPPGAVFRVHEWFVGGDSESVEVWLQRDVVVGERLLVAGEPRWGGDPLEDAVAWECGFTTPYSEARASEWSSAFDEPTRNAAD